MEWILMSSLKQNKMFIIYLINVFNPNMYDEPPSTWKSWLLSSL